MASNKPVAFPISKASKSLPSGDRDSSPFQKDPAIWGSSSRAAPRRNEWKRRYGWLTSSSALQLRRYSPPWRRYDHRHLALRFWRHVPVRQLRTFPEEVILHLL